MFPIYWDLDCSLPPGRNKTDAVGGSGGGSHPPWMLTQRTLSAGFRAEGAVGLTGLASHKGAQKDQQQKRAELEHGLLVRESQEKNNPIVSDMGNFKSNALSVFIQPFFKSSSCFGSASLFTKSFTFQFLPGSNKTLSLTLAVAAANEPVTLSN